MRDEHITDAGLDREIARAMAVDPSPAFVARIRQRIAIERVSRVRTRSRTLWTAVVTGAAVAATIAFAISWRSQRVTPSTPPLLTHAIPGTNVLMVASGTRMFEGRHVLRPASGRPQQRAKPKATAEPEILIDLREARAMRSLLDGVVSGRLDLTPLLGASVPAVMAVEQLQDIDIAPIEFSPLTEKGVPQ